MIMNKRFLYILSALALFVFASCNNEDEPTAAMQRGEIRFSVEDTTLVEVESKAISGLDVKDFNVALSRNGQWIFSSRKYKDIVGTPITCGAGAGYVATAESCTEGEAERANNGWGQVRVAGRQEFTVKPIEPTDVKIQCTLANTSVSVVFSDFVMKHFTDYSITMYAADAEDRKFTFDKDNHSYKTAFFNVGSSNRALQYTTSLTQPGAKEPNIFQGSLTLDPGQSYKITVKLADESKSKLSIQITTIDGTLIEEKELNVKINPYK